MKPRLTSLPLTIEDNAIMWRMVTRANAPGSRWTVRGQLSARRNLDGNYQTADRRDATIMYNIGRAHQMFRVAHLISSGHVPASAYAIMRGAVGKGRDPGEVFCAAP
jgi:hypothetical protein